MPLIEVRLRPTTPWRVGHGAGDRERVDVVFHSDTLYSAVTHAMKTLGWLDEWLAATAQSAMEPVVRFSSLFPFIGRTRLIAPPKTWWPPANPGRLYTEAAKLIPLEVVRNGIVDESRWMVDGETGCMFHTGSGAPVKIDVRTAAAVDRLTGMADPHRIACLEFAANAGYWGVFAVSDPEWESRVKSAIRLLADSGFGGERSRGWGRAASPEFSDASSLLPEGQSDDGAWWLLSLYSPDSSLQTGDVIDWTRGEYTATQRGGWTDSQSGVAPKKQVRMLQEGSVLFAPALKGRAVDVAPDGFPHPVYRAGFALAIPAPPEPVMRQPVQPEPEPTVPESPEELAEAMMEDEGSPPDPPLAQSEPQTAPEPESDQPVEEQQETPAPTEPVTVPNVEPSGEPFVEPVAETEPQPGEAPAAPETVEEPAPEPGPPTEVQPESPAAPEAIEEQAGAPAAVNIEQEIPARSAEPAVETDTQGSSTREDLL